MSHEQEIKDDSARIDTALIQDDPAIAADYVEDTFVPATQQPGRGQRVSLLELT